ncbi:MAG: hypothetical protein RQ847_09170 [Wenzhouxiangellaceae bacterium]|nr:hypothetical protein [Wenzhouxiangellaceae bacterium]
MNQALQHRHRKASTRWSRGILYGMLLLAVLVALPLGMAVAAIGAWFSIQGGSLIYLPLGLVILLTGLAIVHRQSIADLFLLALLAMAAIAWWISGNGAKSWLLGSLAELSGRSELLFGFLAIMVLALSAVHRRRTIPNATG